MSNYAELRTAAESLNDIERVRIAVENRHRAIEQGATGKAPTTLLHTKADTGVLASLQHAEKLQIKNLERTIGAMPEGEWIKRTPGVGLKQGARLVASIGDPLWNEASDRARRGPAELWAYCGLHVIDGEAPRRRKGKIANWNAEAKMRAYLVAESCIKVVGSDTRQRSPFRDVYEARRAHTEQTHPEWTDLHSHRDALRVVAKAVLKDLWQFMRHGG